MLRSRLRYGWDTCFGILVAIAAATPVRAQDITTAFVNVAVVPMDSERVLEGQTVVVRRDRITAIGPVGKVRIPAGARRVDGRGKFLIPGLADMHVHADRGDSAVTERELFLYIANGVTTTREMGFAPKGVLLSWRARAATGEVISPRIYVAAGPRSFNSVGVPARRFVEEAKAAGYDFIKVYGEDGPVLDTIVTTARRVGLPIVGHAPSFMDSSTALQHALAAGYTSIEHLTGFERYLTGRPGDWWWWNYWNDTAFSVADARQLLTDSAAIKLRAMATAMRRAGVWNCPTLAMYDATSVDAADWPELRYFTDSIAAKLRTLQAKYLSPPVREKAQVALEARRAVVRALRDAGAGLLLGTDKPAPFMLPGFAVHRELEAFVRAGLTPYEALATGTRNVAAYLGTLDSAGTIAIGKRADLVLLSGNPLDDIRHTMHPAGVMLGGRWLAQGKLDHAMKAAEGRQHGIADIR